MNRPSRKCDWLLFFVAVGLWGGFCKFMHLGITWIALGMGVIYGLFSYWLEGGGLSARRNRKEMGIELPEPFRAEVLLDGKTVAILSDRIVTEMFWRTYRIDPVDDNGQEAIGNDVLWEGCKFSYRDPVSGMTCDSAFAGGNRPFVLEGRISIRALHFKQPGEPTESR